MSINNSTHIQQPASEDLKSQNQQQPEQDIEAQAESIINAHIADLDFHEEALDDDDDDQVIHYSTVIPKNSNENNMNQEEVEISRSILPSRRKKMLNLRYLTRLRGLVKISQTLFALLLYIAIFFDYDFDSYPSQKVTQQLCPFLITFNVLIINGYVAFPHYSIKDAPTRNGMLFSELITCSFFTIYFMACAPVRAIELIFFKFNLNSLLLTSFFQGPLSILLIYDLFGCFGEWSLVGMRPLGQRVAPKDSNTEQNNAYSNEGFDIEKGKDAIDTLRSK